MVFGLVTLTRPVIFPFFIFLFALLVIFPIIRKEWKNYLILFVLALIVSAPWMVRNSLVFNKVTLTQSSGFGTNLLVGTIEVPLWGDDIWSWLDKHPRLQTKT